VIMLCDFLYLYCFICFSLCHFVFCCQVDPLISVSLPVHLVPVQQWAYSVFLLLFLSFHCLGVWFLLFLNLLFIYSHMHTLFGPFLPLVPYPLPPSLTSRQNQFCPITNFVEEKT
jgi:hypothetical protein